MGWSRYGNQRLSSAEQHGGKSSLELVGDGKGFCSVFPMGEEKDGLSWLQVKPITTYVLRFWYKVRPNGEPLTLNVFTNKRGLTGEAWSTRLVAPDWCEYRLKFVTTVDENRFGVYLYPYYSNRDGGLWVDDIGLYEAE